ncbi:family 43 glycosylhydrolase [Pedobacter sp. LMG 31464]|uniref:Family 43 glycosylhydrolase n=1 Tax=Pedobacter planticolens TaxID=2679964 RepID=A0A923IUL5_9SPHI|nr:family 43 glycosylhydrolase [Pedobacter planticolens]MBB2144898.1 family 43 glycosylhydrolase [Pedobacter planticolens]
MNIPRFFKTVLITLVFLVCANYLAKAQNTAYLFTYFTGNSGAEESIRFAISKDGYTFRALNNNQPIISSSAISETGGVRDPHILRGADGKTFYMVVTDMVSAKGWDSNRAMVLLKSTDLINWTSSIVNIQKRFAGNENLKRVWAPQTIYDEKVGKYMVYWSMKHGNDPDKIYYAYTNADFTDFTTEPKQLYFSPTNGAAIDGEIIYHQGKYHLFYKTEGSGLGIRLAISNELTKGYVLQDGAVQQTKDPVEGAGVFKLNTGEGYILMYDRYMSGKYQFTKTTDFKKFSVIDSDISMDFHPRHGTIMPITAQEAKRLMDKWYQPERTLFGAKSSAIKKINVVTDTSKKTIFLPVKSGTNLKAFNPNFLDLPNISISPKAPYDFSKGPVKITATNGKTKETYLISAAVNNNPVLDGYYADPEILYSKQTGKYYIYPTSDGFNGWSGTYFKTFSSTNLVDWKDEGVILDLPTHTKWAKKNAWAPTIIEKKINGVYKYFYYFTAAQKIGVAVADHPTGPFTDLGVPLISHKPNGIKGGQEIDPDVFTDPKTGKSYLYWGNMYMAVAPLNEDMMSIDTAAIKIITPNSSFREGTEVFYRKGKYYFMWSEDDTRSENYRVRYGYSDSPTGKITIPENNLVLAKDIAQGVYGTGHNSVIQIPGKDEWYIIYHRFTRPKGITMGDAAGFNRETCIDKMEFNEDGSIRKVIPTLKGIDKLK